MNKQEHIAVEELELLALGALPDEEKDALQGHVSGCEECAKRLAQARGHVALLGLAAKPERPAGTIKAELMAKIRVARENEQRNAWRSQVATEECNAKSGMTKDVKSRWWDWVLVPTAVALALLSFGLSWENRRMSARLAKESKATELLLREQERMEKLVGVLAAADTVTVKLAGVEAGANATGTVKYNAKMGMVLYTADLPALHGDQSYQMWLVPVTGAPISAGLLGPGGHAWGNLWAGDVPANTAAKAFAVTIEPAGGTSQPTGPKVLVGAT